MSSGNPKKDATRMMRRQRKETLTNSLIVIRQF
jgi:hypothetical protein